MQVRIKLSAIKLLLLTIFVVGCSSPESPNSEVPATLPEVDPDRGSGGGGGSPTVSEVNPDRGEGPVGGYMIVCAANGLNIRSYPGGPVIGRLKNGQEFSLSGGSSGGWYQLASGGWVNGAFLSLDGCVGDEQPLGEDATVKGAPQQGIPLYQRPDPIKSTVVGWLLNGDSAELTGSKTKVGNQTWYEVRVEKPKKAIGWVNGTYLSSK